MNIRSLLAFPTSRSVRRRSSTAVATSHGIIEQYESRLLLSAHITHASRNNLHPDVKHSSKETGGTFNGIWYIHINGNLAGNIPLVQEGKEVKSLVNDVFTSVFEGKANGNHLKLRSESLDSGSGENTITTWKVDMVSHLHFAGTQTLRNPSGKTTSAITGDY